MKDLKQLKKAKANQSALEMLILANDMREELKNLPANLRDKANNIIYNK